MRASHRTEQAKEAAVARYEAKVREGLAGVFPPDEIDRRAKRAAAHFRAGWDGAHEPWRPPTDGTW